MRDERLEEYFAGHQRLANAVMQREKGDPLLLPGCNTFLELRRKLERATDSLGLVLGRLIHMQDLKLRIYAKGAGLEFEDKAFDKSGKVTCGCPVVKNGQDKTQNDDNMEEDGDCSNRRDYVDLTLVPGEDEFYLQNCAFWQLEKYKLSDSAAWEHLQLLCNAAFDDVRKRANLIEKVADEAWVKIPVLTSYRLPEEKKKNTLAGRKRERDAED